LKLVRYAFIAEALLLMFSTFPDGWPGTGLVLLRIACGALLTLQGVAYVRDYSSQRWAAWLLAFVALSSGILLLIGCLTRLAAVVAAVACTSGVFTWLPAPSLDFFAARLPGILVAVVALAVICLGPGAFSVDAIVFGRHEVVIPKSPRQTDL
jgi:uncharacterized membrane protein YphA (DoxX/SURF4 family)